MNIRCNEDYIFLVESIKEIEKHIKDINAPARIDRVYFGIMGCEWCSNETKFISFGFEKTIPNAPSDTKGFCNTGNRNIYKDKSWRSQGEWYVCGKCEQS